MVWLEKEVGRWIDNCETLKHPVEYKLPEIFIPHLERNISCNRKFNGMPYLCQRRIYTCLVCLRTFLEREKCTSNH